MNARERLFAALEGRETDRTPIWLLFPYHKTGYYTDVRNNPHYKDIVAMAEKYAITLNRRGIGANLFAPAVKIENKTITEEGVRISRKVLEYKGRQLVSETRYGKETTTVRKLIKNGALPDGLLDLPWAETCRCLFSCRQRACKSAAAEPFDLPELDSPIRQRTYFNGT